MILSAATLRLIKPLTPFCERGVIRGKSYGLSVAGYDIRIAENHDLRGGDFALGSSLEKFSMPKNLVALVKDKSSWARQGLSLFNTVIEPGWRGFLTLELKNESLSPLRVEAGDAIAQILFFTTDEVTEGYSSRYQDQEAGPQKYRHEQQTPTSQLFFRFEPEKPIPPTTANFPNFP